MEKFKFGQMFSFYKCNRYPMCDDQPRIHSKSLTTDSQEFWLNSILLFLKGSLLCWSRYLGVYDRAIQNIYVENQVTITMIKYGDYDRGYNRKHTFLLTLT